MALTPQELAAVNTLNNTTGNDYPGDPGGLGNDGHRANFVPALQAVATVGQAAAREAGDAAAAAASASAQSASLSGTSTTSVAISAGSKTLTTQAGKVFSPGTFLLLTSNASPTTHYLGGQVTAYSGTSLTVNVTTAAGSGSRADWTIRVAGAVGPGGHDGRAIQIQNSGTHIQWRYAGDSSWTDIIAVADLEGADGREIELQTSATHIQWRYTGMPGWTDLVALADLAGADGREVELQRGVTHIQWRYTGDPGWTDLIALADFDGDDGREVEIQKSVTHIQWRYVGDPIWTDLVALADLIGGTGPAPTLTIGTVTSGPSADVSITGSDGVYELDLVLPASTVPGPAGAQILNGARDPASGDGNNGDYWLQSADGATGGLGDFWAKAGGTWAKLFSTRGPAGEGSGDVTGPGGGVTDSEFALFNGTTGKAIRASGTTLSALTASISAKYSLPDGGTTAHYIQGDGTLAAISAFATAAQGELADSAVQPARTVSPGTGLTGGGDLSANRIISLSSASVASLALADTAVQPAGITGKEDKASKGAANGYAGLDAAGKVPIGQLPDVLLGAVIYQGAWNASTNVPVIPAASSANKGHYRIVTVAGSTIVNGESDWKGGDWIVSDGTVWSKVDNTDQVVSVNGKLGAVVLTASDIGVEAGADVTDATNVGTAIHGSAAKTTPVDADTLALINSAASNVLSRVTWANVKSTLKTYFDGLYAAASSVLSLASAAEVRAGADTVKALGVAETWNAHAPVSVNLAALNLATFINGVADVGSNTTVSNPQNISPGRTGWIYVTIDGTRTVSFGSVWKKAVDSPDPPTTGEFIISYAAVFGGRIVYSIAEVTP